MRYYISSSSRISGTSSNFCVRLPTKMLPGSYTLISLRFVNAYYNVNDTNNKVYFYDTQQRTATLTNGHYTASSLISNLETAMNAASNSNTYTVTFSDSTAKYTVTASTNPFIFTFSSYRTNTARFLLGFDQSDTSASALSITSDNVINLTPFDGFLLRINDIDQVACSSGQVGTFVIPNYQLFGDISQVNPYQEMEVKSDTTELRVKVLDLNGTELVLNGINWTMMLERNVTVLSASKKIYS